MRCFALLLAFITELCIAVAEEKGELAMGQNLIRNPGFEDVNDAHKPAGWTANSPRANLMPLTVVDEAVFLGGKQSLRMSGDGNPNCMGKVVQKVPVAGGHTYLVSASVKAQNIVSLYLSFKGHPDERVEGALIYLLEEVPWQA